MAKKTKLRATLVIALAIVCAGLLSFVPFPVQLAPAVSLTLVDDQGNPVGEIEGRYSFTNYPSYDNIEVYFHIPRDGKIELSRHRSGVSLASRLVNHVVGGIVPEARSRVGAQIELFKIPRTYQIDGPYPPPSKGGLLYHRGFRYWEDSNGLAYSTGLADDPLLPYDFEISFYEAVIRKKRKWNLVLQFRKVNEKIPEDPPASEPKPPAGKDEK